MTHTLRKLYLMKVTLGLIFVFLRVQYDYIIIQMVRALVDTPVNRAIVNHYKAVKIGLVALQKSTF